MICRTFSELLLYKFNLITPLLDDKILALSKLQTFADYNLKVSFMAKFVLHRVEKFMGKGEISGYSPFPTIFSKAFCLRVGESVPQN